MILVIILIFIWFFQATGPILATIAPVPLDPPDNSILTQSSLKLSWGYSGECYQAGSCFKVEIDDSNIFDSVDKYTYTNNRYYSPQNLAAKKWFWRVKAKDLSDTWSSFSLTRSFTLTTSGSNPAPQPSPSPSSTPSLLPSQSSPSTSFFTISGVPSQIDSNQTFTVPVDLVLSNNPNTTFYLKGAFKKSDSNNYFGLTKVGSSWIKNGSSYLNQYKVTTDALGNWSGSLEIKPDTDDTGFEGTGDYIFKVARYTSSGSGPTWSNEATINLIAVEEESIKGGTDLQTTSANNNRPKKSSEVKGLIKTNVKKVPFDSSPSSQVKQSTPQAKQSTYSAQVKNSKQTYPLIILGTVLITIGLGSIIYILWRQQKLKS